MRCNDALKTTVRVSAAAVIAFGLASCGNDGAADSVVEAPNERAAPTTSPATIADAEMTDEQMADETADDEAMTGGQMPDESMAEAADDEMTDHSMAGDEMTDHSMADGEMTDHSMAGDEHANWPRPFDPADPVDFSDVAGATPAQVDFAENLVNQTISDLPAFADPADAEAAGFRSIGDAALGHEHYINYAYLTDDYDLDPRYPESVVYEVDGDERTLVSAMYIKADSTINDPELEKIGGPILEWHHHDDLCWSVGDDGTPKVVGTHGEGQPCPAGSLPGGEQVPMVHVWIAPHECGAFAALEGVGAGQATVGDEDRTDLCSHEH